MAPAIPIKCGFEALWHSRLLTLSRLIAPKGSVYAIADS
jgi:hypothetical protein